VFFNFPLLKGILSFPYMMRLHHHTNTTISIEQKDIAKIFQPVLSNGDGDNIVKFASGDGVVEPLIIRDDGATEVMSVDITTRLSVAAGDGDTMVSAGDGDTMVSAGDGATMVSSIVV
jgi:hypothetical protein